jgi:hypothetical protein
VVGVTKPSPTPIWTRAAGRGTSQAMTDRIHTLQGVRNFRDFGGYASRHGAAAAAAAAAVTACSRSSKRRRHLSARVPVVRGGDGNGDDMCVRVRACE